MKKLIISSLMGLLLLGCVNMDIPKKNTVSEETLFSTASGMDKYLARLYSYMPREDFKYRNDEGLTSQGYLVGFGEDGSGEAVDRNGITRSFTGEDFAYWNSDRETAKPFVTLRDCNTAIENFPKYKDNFADVTYGSYLGQVYFVRAMVFYAMAKRFGGVPLVTRTIDYPGDNIEVARSSEEDTWNQILADFDMAASLMSDNTGDITLANKYVALAYKAEAMNYAGSVAKYNSEYGLSLNAQPGGAKTGVRVIGFADGAAASKRYFAEAYKAADAVIQSGRYDLQRASENTPEAKYQNMARMFSGEDKALLRSSPENMFVREFVYPDDRHAFDAYNQPAQFRPGPNLTGSTCPTLDFVELFDGLPRNTDGHLKVTTSNDSNAEGNYELFAKPMDLFATAEPRLRAYVILPGDVFKGQEIEVRTAVYTGTESNIEPLGRSNGGYGYSNATKLYTSYGQQFGAGSGEAKMVYGESFDSDEDADAMIEYNGAGNVRTITANGKRMLPGSGASGPFLGGGNEWTLTGFHLRKWLNPDPAVVGTEAVGSLQPYIYMRYADVLLAAAEAAVELSIAGESAPAGTNADMLGVATQAIADIQDRAGATLTGAIAGTEAGRDIVRKERRKELAFEHKSKWDLRRWRVLHREGRDGFWGEQSDASSFSNGSGTEYRFRGLYPFFSTANDKWFFDARFQYNALKTFDYHEIDYYFIIPTNEVTKSPLIDQQPNRD